LCWGNLLPKQYVRFHPFDRYPRPAVERNLSPVFDAPPTIAEGSQMSGLKLGAILLIVAGALAAGIGAFTYNRETHWATVGPMEVSVTERRTVNIPAWAGGGAMVLGAVLLLARKKIEA
jgi:hypothetical protein